MGNPAEFHNPDKGVSSQNDDQTPCDRHEGQDLTGRYEPPRLIVLGKVRTLTTGSASSGKQDANSQYYW